MNTNKVNYRAIKGIREKFIGITAIINYRKPLRKSYLKQIGFYDSGMEYMNFSFHKIVEFISKREYSIVRKVRSVFILYFYRVLKCSKKYRS